MNGNGNGHDESDPGRTDEAWPDAERTIGLLETPFLRETFREALARQRELLARLTRVDRAGEKRDKKLTTIAGALLSLERQGAETRAQVDVAIALMHGVAAVVARSEDERKQIVEAVDALEAEAAAVRARNAAHDAADAATRVRLEEIARDIARVSHTAEDTASRAALASEKAAEARIAQAEALARLGVSEEARKSHHDDDMVEQAAKLARRAQKSVERWKIATGVLLLVIGAAVTLASKYLEPKAPAPAPALTR